MNIDFNRALYHALLKVAKEQGKSIPALVNELLPTHPTLREHSNGEHSHATPRSDLSIQKLRNG